MSEDEYIDAPSDIRICACGCTEAEHDGVGRCRFCDECDGFTVDEEASYLAAVLSFIDED